GIGNLEENVFHDVGRVRDLKLKLFALESCRQSCTLHEKISALSTNLEQNVVEAPSFSRQHSRKTFFSFLNEESQVNGTCTCISCSPGFARTSVRCVAVSSKGLSINPCLRNRIDGLRVGKASGNWT